MECLMLWHGGHSYSVPTIEDEPDRCESIADAVRLFRDRLSNRDGRTPCVDESASAWLYLGEQVGDYPDRVIEIGPRGGVRVVRC